MSEASFKELSGGQNKVVSNKGKVLILCLDRSGSMNGRPFESLKVGVLQIAEAVLGQNRPFERFISILYDDRVEDSEKASFEEYQNYIKAANTRGCTDFVKCFTWMDDFCQKNKNKIEELTVIFFTDGLDNCNHKQKIRESFE